MKKLEAFDPGYFLFMLFWGRKNNGNRVPIPFFVKMRPSTRNFNIPPPPMKWPGFARGEWGC